MKKVNRYSSIQLKQRNQAGYVSGQLSKFKNICYGKKT